jgi:hypothetical protein
MVASSLTLLKKPHICGIFAGEVRRRRNGRFLDPEESNGHASLDKAFRKIAIYLKFRGYYKKRSRDG